MPTVEYVARGVLAAIDSDASLVLAQQWVNERFQQIAARARLRALRKLGTISLPSKLSTGTVDATRDSAVIVGDGTAAAAWDAALVGRHIRVRNAWYEIVGVNGDELTLDAPYAEDSVAAYGYVIVQRFVPLPRDVRHIGTLVHARRWVAIQRVNQSELDRMSPSRSQVGGTPFVFAEAPPGPDNSIKRLELYPYSDISDVVHFTYWADPPQLELHDEIPGDIPAHTLKEGALIDLFRYESGRQARLGNVEAAGFYRNEARTQRTQWENKDMPEAIGADGGSDDVRFIAWNVGRGLIEGDIMTARDQVWSGYR